MKPWREIAVPHKDVLEGTLKQSEFAADITHVVQGTASPGYQDAEKFFARTYITEGMRLLLISVANRLSNGTGDPVIQLQTNFGGGKTHTLLAVYHLVKQSKNTGKLAGIPTLLDEAGIMSLPHASIAVIDGTNLSPNQPTERDGLKIRTVWGQIAYQLLGADGYEMVRDSDEVGASPGKEVFVSLLKKVGPCVILMDELVAFYRQMDGTERLTAGTLESNMSFIQVLTESVKAVPHAILLASLPESNTEVVGTFGQQVLTTLEKYFGRVENVWKPVAADESFEIVRRRLFKTIGSTAEMEATCAEFMDYYRKNKAKLPSEVQEGTYAERLKKSYPIHPEVFDRLYQDWSTLDKFQKTRGVLQYMAIIIHRLWQVNDQDPMIMPGSIPLEDSNVRTKSTHYLPPGWDPIIEKEIDGDTSAAAEIDKDTRFGAIFAARRAARTIFLGSAPYSSNNSHRGIAVERILLGAAVPGHMLAVYEDVLSRLRDRLHYLFADVNQFWFETHPNLRREMESRKERIELTRLNKTLKEAMSKIAGQGDIFAGVHSFTPHGDIPDEVGNGPRLVILPPKIENAYAKGNEKLAFDAAETILTYRGDQQRIHRNRLFFLAPDQSTIQRLTDQCRTYLAWQEIIDDCESGRQNMGLFQVKQAKRDCEAAQNAMDQMVRECYRILMIPIQKSSNKVGFDVRKIPSSSASKIAVIVEKTLLEGEFIIQHWSPLLMNKHLTENYFKNGETEVSARKVWMDCCDYYFMPRLQNEGVFERTLIDGVSKGDYFGFADGKDGDKYMGFKLGDQVFNLGLDEQALLIEHDAAAAYKAANAPKPTSSPGEQPDESGGSGAVQPVSGRGTQPQPPSAQPAEKKYKKYYGAAVLKNNCASAALEVQELVDEIVMPMAKLPGVKVRLKLIIEVASESPFDSGTIRTVRENSNAMNLSDHEFNEE